MDVGLDLPFWARQLRYFRTRKAWSQHDLAREVNRLDAQARLDGNTISRWERGLYRPSPFYTRLLCRGFGVSPTELGLVDPEIEEAPVLRRDFLRDSIGIGALAALGPAVSEPMERIGHNMGRLGGIDGYTAAALEQVTVAIEQLYLRCAPAALLGPAKGHLDAVTGLLRCPMTASIRGRLCSIAGETAGLVAWIKAASGDTRGAARYLPVALEAAREAGDYALGAFTVGHFTCAQTIAQLEPATRLRHFTEGGFGFAARSASARTRVWLAAKAADVHALLGSQNACLWALDEAQQLLSSMGSHDDGDYPRESRPRCSLSTWDERWLAGERGASLARLGESHLARRALDEAGATDLDLGHDRFWLQVARARTYISDGEPGEACRLVSEVVAGAARSDQSALLEAAGGLLAQMRSWGDHPLVRDLDEQLAMAV